MRQAVLKLGTGERELYISSLTPLWRALLLDVLYPWETRGGRKMGDIVEVSVVAPAVVLPILEPPVPLQQKTFCKMFRVECTKCSK